MTTMWDDRKAPEPDLIADCVHCGFCLPTCPTYALWGEEMDSPRGRIAARWTSATRRARRSPTRSSVHLDNCLGCMACVTACPSGVQYDKLIEDARQQVERQVTRPAAASAGTAGSSSSSSRTPAACARSRRCSSPQRRLGLDEVRREGAEGRHARGARAARSRSGRRCGSSRRSRRRRASGARPSASCRAASSGCSSATSTRRRSTCSPRRASRSTRCASRAAAARCSCTRARTPRRWSSRRRRSTAFEPFDVVVTNAAGCGSAMKDYAHVLREEPGWAERAEAFSQEGPRHLRAARRARAAGGAPPGRPRPRRLPRRLPPRPRPGHPRAAARAAARDPRPGGRRPRRLGDLLRIGRRLQPAEPRARTASWGCARLENLRATGAEVIAAANPGCALQINAVATEQGEPLRILHPIEVLRGIDHREEPDHIMSTTSTSRRDAAR